MRNLAVTDPARVTFAAVVGPSRLRLAFRDGSSGEVDLAPLLAGRGGLLAALRDPDVFRQAQLDTETGTVAWPNGVDLDPDVLHALATGASIETVEG